MKRPEDALQEAVIGHLRARLMPGVVWWHTPNGMRSSPRNVARFKKLGLLPGIPDLLFLHGGRLFGLELKAKGRKPTSEQDDCHQMLRWAGAEVFWTSDLDIALMWLADNGLIRKAAVAA